MQTVAKRISKKTQSLTQRLTRLREGPASIALPGNVKEVEMSFAMRNRDYGARRFLKFDVPSILYKNPKLSFKQNRPERIPDPTLVVRFDDGNSTSISLKSKSQEDILAEFKQLLSSSPSTSTTSSTSPSSSRPHPASSHAQDAGASSTGTASSQQPPPPTPKGEVESGVDVGTARE